MCQADVLKKVMPVLMKFPSGFLDYRLEYIDMSQFGKKDLPRSIMHRWASTAMADTRIVSATDAVSRCSAGNPAAVQVEPIDFTVFHIASPSLSSIP